MVTNHDLSTTNSSGGEPFTTVFQELESRELHLRFYVASDQEFALPAMAIRVNVPLDRITRFRILLLCFWVPLNFGE